MREGRRCDRGQGGYGALAVGPNCRHITTRPKNRTYILVAHKNLAYIKVLDHTRSCNPTAARPYLARAEEGAVSADCNQDWGATGMESTSADCNQDWFGAPPQQKRGDSTGNPRTLAGTGGGGGHTCTQ